MVQVFLFPLIQCFVLTYRIKWHRRHFVFCVTPFSVVCVSSLSCTPLTFLFFTLQNNITVSNDACIYLYTCTRICCWLPLALLVYHLTLTWRLSSTGEASSSKCGQTSVPWDFSLLPVNHTAGIGKLLFVLWKRLHVYVLSVQLFFGCLWKCRGCRVMHIASLTMCCLLCQHGGWLLR